MSILINKDTKVITQGITGKTGQFHTEKCQEYANGKNCFIAGVYPQKAGESIFGIPIFAWVKEAATETGATVSVIYVPPPGAAAAIWEAVEADLAHGLEARVGLEGLAHGRERFLRALVGVAGVDAQEEEYLRVRVEVVPIFKVGGRAEEHVAHMGNAAGARALKHGLAVGVGDLQIQMRVGVHPD